MTYVERTVLAAVENTKNARADFAPATIELEQPLGYTLCDGDRLEALLRAPAAARLRKNRNHRPVFANRWSRFMARRRSFLDLAAQSRKNSRSRRFMPHMRH